MLESQGKAHTMNFLIDWHEKERVIYLWDAPVQVIQGWLKTAIKSLQGDICKSFANFAIAPPYGNIRPLWRAPARFHAQKRCSFFFWCVPMAATNLPRARICATLPLLRVVP